jgi:hypothetical protein
VIVGAGSDSAVKLKLEPESDAHTFAFFPPLVYKRLQIVLPQVKIMMTCLSGNGGGIHDVRVVNWLLPPSPFLHTVP